MAWIRSTCARLMTGPSATWLIGSPTGRCFALSTSFLGQRRDDLVPRQHAAGGHADLALVEPGAEGDRRRRGVEIGVLEYDHGVLAAEFELHLLQMLAGELADPAPDRARTGEGHHRDVGIGADRLAGLGAARQDMQDALRKAGLLENAGDDEAPGESGARIGLEHDGVAGRERGRHRAARKDQRKVERRNDADDATRQPPRQADAARIGGQHQALRLSAHRGGTIENFRHHVDFEAGLGRNTPDGPMEKERYRLVMEGPPNWTSFREFWKMFYEEGAVVVASSYTKVGGLYDRGFRHDPTRPLESLADYCMGCYTNLGLPTRVELLERYIREYSADGFMINSVKSCNSFSVGQLLMLRQLEERTGVPGGFIESDLVDPRYFSAANIKNRIESYLQMLEQKRAARVA